ncbi:hypothetical protein [Zwartia sp.]|uniref:hypothetical protein n=1 Tax=Zwartia sp. TaxID=2978004 RepID=UPI002726EA32|nr:hypothetical protein [Zwartia sp.]MDO9023176.1 hypothetical protein [Zwartia sp.]
MKKSITLAVAAVALTASALAPAHARPNKHRHVHSHGYYQGQNFNAWNAAAIGAAVGVVIGVGSQYNRYVAPPPVVYPRVVNVYPPAVPPYGQYYSLPVPCRTAQIPVYDQYGRLVQYQQTCVN